jgi:hypothetical protein
MYLDAGDITLRTAAELCGSNAHYVAAAAVILKSEDRALQEAVLDGKVPLLAAAKAMEQTANLVAAYRAADNAIKSVFTALSRPGRFGTNASRRCSTQAAPVPRLMRMRRNPELDAGLATLAEAGIRDVTVARGAKHLQLRWLFNNQPRMMTVSCSPSDWRGSRNLRTEIRRQVRLDGLLPEVNGSASAPSKVPHWREQVETLSRRLSQILVPGEKVAERVEIVAALRRLIHSDGLTQEAVDRKEVTAQ